MSLSALHRSLGLNFVFGVMFMCVRGKMPIMAFTKRGLQLSSQLLFGRARRLILDESTTFSFQPILDIGPLETLHHSSRKLLGHPVLRITRNICSLRNMMPACSSFLGLADHYSKSIKSKNLFNAVVGSVVGYGNRIHFPDASRSFDIQKLGCNSISLYGGTRCNFIGLNGIECSFSGCNAAYSVGSARDVTLDGSLQDDQVGDLENPSKRILRLQSGSSYWPHPDKEETGGEDAHFIYADKHVIGVADGVGGWANVGIDAGYYARELMLHAEEAARKEPEGFIDPMRVLEKAYSSTKAKGSSTACIVSLTGQEIHAVNLGDSGFVVIREGCIIFRSPVQQHDFNFTYQLSSDDGGDLPSASQVFTVPVEPGDVIVVGTDGLFDNLYHNEISSVVVHAIRAGLEPQATAQKIAALARQRAQDEQRQTPFATAAQDAGFRCYGGKMDDITVVVSYINASTSSS